MKRRRLALLAAALLPLALLLGGVAVLPRVELAGFAERRLAAALGRDVGIGRLRVSPGRVLVVEASDLRLANLAGAPRPDMIRVGRLRAELDLAALLRGEVRLGSVLVEDAAVVLESVGGTPNWRFPTGKAGGSKAPALSIPTVRALTGHRVAIDYASRGGYAARLGLDDVTLASEADDRPVGLAGAGTYNGFPVSLDASLGSFDQFRQAGQPFPTRLRLRSGEATLAFDGTMTKPLDLDGAVGSLSLDAPSLSSLLALGDVSAQADIALSLAGAFVRGGDDWTLTDAAGRLAGSPVTARRLALHEGGGGRPDSIVADLTIDRVDLNALPITGSGGAGQGADIPLAAIADPDPLLDLKVEAPALDYAGWHFSDVRVAASRGPGLIRLADLALTWLGARAQASGQADSGGVAARVTVQGASVDRFRRQLGFPALPLDGRIDLLATLAARAPTLNRAVASAQVAAVASLAGGTIQQRIMELASQDLRLLFRRASGTTPITCLLAAASMNRGVGTVSPFRLATGRGALAGYAAFDLNRRVFDLVFASERATTSFWALDEPVRANGSFSDPQVGAARLSRAGRADLARVYSLPPLPAELMRRARASPCLRTRR